MLVYMRVLTSSAFLTTYLTSERMILQHFFTQVKSLVVKGAELERARDELHSKNGNVNVAST